MSQPNLEFEKDEQRLLAVWAADCAERALPLFEAIYPQDYRPRKAIEAARAWARGEIRVGRARLAAFAAHAAARGCETSLSTAAARAAGHAAATAHVAAHARHAAEYAALAKGLDAEENWPLEKSWQAQHLAEPLRLRIFPVDSCWAAGGRKAQP